MGSLGASAAFPSASASFSRKSASSLHDGFAITTEPVRKAEMTISSLPESRGDGGSRSIAGRLRGGGYIVCGDLWESIRKTCCGAAPDESDNQPPLQPEPTTRTNTERRTENNKPTQQEKDVGDSGPTPSSGAREQDTGVLGRRGTSTGGSNRDDPPLPSPKSQQEPEKSVQEGQPSEQGGINLAVSPPSLLGTSDQAPEKHPENGVVSEPKEAGNNTGTPSPPTALEQDKDQSVQSEPLSEKH